MEEVKELNNLIIYAKYPKTYKKDSVKCLDEFFEKTKNALYEPSKYQKNILDYYEKALYNSKYKEELKLEKVPYYFDEAYYIYANILVSKHKFEEAITYLEKALEWNPVKRKAILLICKIYFTLNEFKKAFEYAISGLEVEYVGSNILYYYSVLTVYYLKNNDYLRADEYAKSIFLLDKNDEATIKYLSNRKINEIIPTSQKNEAIIDALLEVIQNSAASESDKTNYAKSLLSYEIMPIFKFEDFYLTLESGVKNFKLKDSVLVNGNYLLANFDGKKYLDIKDKNHEFRKIVANYLDRIHDCNLYDEKYQNEKDNYEKEPICEELKIKYNGHLYYLANIASNKEMSSLYLELKNDILAIAHKLVQGKKTTDDLFKFSFKGSKIKVNDTK